MQSKFFPRLITFILLLTSLTACLSLAEDITPPPGYQAPSAPQITPDPAISAAPVYPILPPDPARGEPLYAEKCAPCHGENGLGDGPDAEMLSNPVAPLGDPDLARLAAPADWYMMVTNGNMGKFMPPFSSLSMPERWDVIAYAYTLSTPPDEIARGQSLYDENCAICHGLRGQGDGQEAGGLSVSPIDFTDQEFMGTRSAADLFQSITDGLGEMHSYADMAEDDRWALTSFLRRLAFAEATSQSTAESDLTGTPQSDEIPEISLTPEDDTGDASATPGETPPATEVESGVVTETVGTVTIEIVAVSGNPLPSDLEVKLYSYEDMAQVYSKTLSISNDGIAMANDVPMQPEQFIFATTDYQGVVYGSDVAVLEPEMRSLNLTIPYYEQTRDISVLKAERLHIFFEFLSEDTIQVYVLYIFSNSSDKVLAAENSNEPVLVFNLPEGATNLQHDSGMDFQDVDLPNGFGLLTVYPSAEQYQILYSFEMPYEKNKVDFELPIGLDTSAVIAMMPEIGIEIKSDQLMDAGMRDIEGVSYNMYNGSNLQAGDFLGMQVSGKPKMTAVAGEASTGVEPSTGLVIGLGVFGMMLVGAGVYLWARNRARGDAVDNMWDDKDQDDSADLPESEDPDDLMDAIITLDDLYQAGEIPEDAYLKRRVELKERLRELLVS